MITNIFIVGIKIAVGVAGAIAIGAASGGMDIIDLSDVGNHLDSHSGALEDYNFHADLHKFIASR